MRRLMVLLAQGAVAMSVLTGCVRVIPPSRELPPISAPVPLPSPTPAPPALRAGPGIAKLAMSEADAAPALRSFA